MDRTVQKHPGFERDVRKPEIGLGERQYFEGKTHMKNIVGILVVSLLSLVISPPSAHAGWKAVKMPPKPGNDTQTLRDKGPGWKVIADAEVVSIGSSVDGEASIELTDLGYANPNEPVLVQSITAKTNGTYRRSWKYVPTADKPVGEVEYNGKAYAHYKGQMNGESYFGVGVKAILTADTDGAKAEANATLEEFAALGGKEDEVEKPLSLVKCPVKAFTLTHQALALVKAESAVGDVMVEEPTPHLMHIGGGTAKVHADGSNTDETLALISLTACP